MLAALLPLIEALSAEGGAAGAIAGSAEAGGIGSALGRMFGGTKAFGSNAELGGALRKISDLAAGIDASKQAMAQKHQQQEAIASKARNDERQYAFSDPAHTKQLADLVRQQQAHADEIHRSQREIGELRTRAAVTTDPRAANAASWRQAATVLGTGTVAANLAPRIIQNLPAVQAAGNFGQAAQNMAGEVAGPTNSAIAGQAWQYGRQTVGMGMNPMNALHPMRATADLSLQLSKLPALLKEWGESLVQSQRYLGKFNGTMAMANAESERRGILRAIGSGQRTGGPTAELNLSLENLKDQIQPIRDTVTVVIANSLRTGIELLSTAVDVVKMIHAGLKELPLIGDGLKEIEKRLVEAQKSTLNNREGPIREAFRDSARRDPSKRLGVPKR
jgi:hypothetical protein